MKVTVERLGHLGDGIAPGPVYVPLSLPGEVVEGAVEGGRMAAPRIVTPAPERVAAPCPHFRRCGGCALQHASDAFVRTWKADVVCAALAARGLEAPVRGIATSPPMSRRRAVLSGRRTKKGATVGFHARGSDLIVEVPDCRLLVPEIMAAIPVLEEIVRDGASRKGEVALTVTASEAGVDVSVSGGKPLSGPLQARLAEIAGARGLARLAWDGEVVVTLAPPAQRFDSVAVVPPPGAFLQATAHGETALRRAVTEAVGAAGRIADLFAGCGTFALPLASGAEVHAVESDAAMLAALDAGWRGARGLKAVTTEARDLFRRPLMPDELTRFDAVVIDPPRAGAAAQTAALAEARLSRIASVSCNPVTFARDAEALVRAGYRLDWIEVVDQFRWSPHVELAAQFSRDHMAPEPA